MHDQYPASLGNYVTHHVVYLHVLVWPVISALDLSDCFVSPEVSTCCMDLHGIPAKTIQLSSCNCTCMHGNRFFNPCLPEIYVVVPPLKKLQAAVFCPGSRAGQPGLQSPLHAF